MCIAHTSPLGAFVHIRQMCLLLLADRAPHHGTQLYRVQYELWPPLTKLVMLACAQPNAWHRWYAKRCPKHPSNHYWLSYLNIPTIVEFLVPFSKWSANIFCTGPDSKYFRICGPSGLLCLCSSAAALPKHHGEYGNTWEWLGSSKAAL